MHPNQEKIPGGLSISATASSGATRPRPAFLVSSRRSELSSRSTQFHRRLWSTVSLDPDGIVGGFARILRAHSSEDRAFPAHRMCRHAVVWGQSGGRSSCRSQNQNDVIVTFDEMVQRPDAEAVQLMELLRQVPVATPAFPQGHRISRDSA